MKFGYITLSKTLCSGHFLDKMPVFSTPIVNLNAIGFQSFHGIDWFFQSKFRSSVGLQQNREFFAKFYFDHPV